MSKTQFDWLINNLKNAQGRWKVIGNQVILSDINVGFAANNPTSLAEISFYEDQFLDSWEGYLLQRNALVDSIQKNNMKNVVFASGDSHASWAFDVTKQPVMYPVAQFSYIPQPNLYNPNTKTGYTPTTGEGSVAVEFCTPSISAENFDEILTVEISNLFEAIINNPIPQIPGSPNYNPHLKYVDFDRHGYLILDVRADSVQSDFFYTPSVVTVSTVDNWGGGVSSTYNSNHITTASTANRAAAKAVQDFPAPTARVVTALTENVAPVVFSLYPNPASSTVNVQYGLVRDADVDLMLVSIEGRIVKNIAQFKNQAAGVYSISNIDVSGLARGMYLLQIKTGNGITYRKFVIN
jgi:alkaline phosphatase D